MILNLAVAVKELVENSVDAGARIIEIKIKNYGAEGFEISDNGSGIDENNFLGITAKHYTSKLRDFNDLESIKTFGFRGEALSSLCSVSNVTIVTRDSKTEHGTKLHFNHDGTIKKKLICARNFGTTVNVTDFFITLPVRRSEFLKNYKKDFQKMTQLLQEYCLVLTGVKIICTNQPTNGPRQTVLNTSGLSVLENIISIFGHKQAKDLLQFKAPTDNGSEDGIYTQQSVADLDNSSSMLDIKDRELDRLNTSNFKIEGYVSNIDHECGRPSKDRQYFYINSRPVDLKSISKIVNEVYNRYNARKYPFVYMNLKMDQSDVDVNLSKDKRQVLVNNDKILCLAVKRSILNTFGEMPTKFRFVSVNNSVTDATSDDDDEDIVQQPATRSIKTLKQWSMNPADLTRMPSPTMPFSSHKRKLSNGSSGRKKEEISRIKISFHEQLEMIDKRKAERSISSDLEETYAEVSKVIDCKAIRPDDTLCFEKLKQCNESSISSVCKDDSFKSTEDIEINESIKVLEDKFFQLKEPMSDSTDEVEDDEDELDCNITLNPASKLESTNTSLNSSMSTPQETIEIDEPKASKSNFSSKISVTLDSIKAQIKAEEEAQSLIDASKQSRKLKLRFKESIDPSKNKKAETELETELKKEMFSELEVIGQFNLGFIIAKLNSDLFIVDQHASDEKYNFENLQNTTQLQTQPLVVPEKLELTAIQEITLIENLKIFEINGFKFLIDHDAAPTQKIRIHSKPFSKKWEFGKDDIEEMIFMLQDAPNTMCRPSRIRTMLASRACRKSVMIGTPLQKPQMKKLLTQMGEIEHPWNCPHGRPTIRYLQNLDFIDGLNND